MDDPSTLPEGNIYSRQVAWQSFRIGPAYPTQYPDQQFPAEYLDDYVRQLVPSYRSENQNRVIADDLVALIDKLGPCILIGWSTGTYNVLDAAALRPNLVKGVVGLEGTSRSVIENPERLASVPVLILWGDSTSHINARAFTDMLVGLGGDASTIHLPDVGLHGNGHSMMTERNSEQIADVVENWIQQHVSGVRGRYTNP